MTRIDINDGNAHLAADITEGHEPNYREYEPKHPFVARALEVVQESNASLYGVHIYVLIDEDDQRDGVYFDYGPRVPMSAALPNESWGLERSLEAAGFITARKNDGRFRRNRSKYAVAAVGHEVLGDRVPSDFDREAETETEAEAAR